MRKELLLGAAVTLASLCLGECALRVVAPVDDPYEHLKWPRGLLTPEYIESQFDPNMRVTFEIEPGLPGVTGINTFTTNNAGFRGDPLPVPKPPDEFRVFMVGGSTTECLILDDYDAVTAVLQRELTRHLPDGPTFRVYNAGKTGDRTDDHVAMIVHRILLMEPDMIIVFGGINDLRAAMHHVDFRHYTYDIRTLDQEGGSRSRPAPYRLTFWSFPRLAAYEFQIGRRIYYLAHQAARPAEASLVDMSDATLEELMRMATARGRVLPTDIRARVEGSRAAEKTDERPRTDLGSYRANLVTIAAAAGAHGVPLVLMTQQTTWNSQMDPGVTQWQWMNTVGVKSYRVDLMDAAMEEYNDVVRDLARELSLPLYDPARELPKSLEYFYDDVHFNIGGARTAGEQLAALIMTAAPGQKEAAGRP